MNTLGVWAPYPQLLAPPEVVSSLPAANVTPATDEASALVTSRHGSRATGDPDGVDETGDVLGAGDDDPEVELPHATSSRAASAVKTRRKVRISPLNSGTARDRSH